MISGWLAQPDSYHLQPSSSPHLGNCYNRLELLVQYLDSITEHLPRTEIKSLYNPQLANILKNTQFLKV